MKKISKNIGVSYEPIRVACYSGYKTHERPVSFSFQERCWKVSEILDRWYEGGLDPTRPLIDYFKVKTTNGRVFTLRYLSLFDAWSIRV